MQSKYKAQIHASGHNYTPPPRPEKIKIYRNNASQVSYHRLNTRKNLKGLLSNNNFKDVSNGLHFNLS